MPVLSDPTFSPQFHVCSICNKAIERESTKIDESGKTVHEKCYVQRVGVRMEHSISSAGSRRPHQIGILMSPSGRFLECLHCQLRFEFPQGTFYATVSAQFASRPCNSTVPTNDYSKKS